MRGGGSKRAHAARLQKEAYDRAMAETRKRHTCRSMTGEIGGAGECLKCDAEAGVACRAIRP